MRKITEQSIEAFLTNTEFKKANMEVHATSHGTYMYLHRNLIAQKVDGVISISDGGWATNTTKERLNGFDFVQIYQSAGDWFLNDQLWDGSLISVGSI